VLHRLPINRDYDATNVDVEKTMNEAQIGIEVRESGKELLQCSIP
jgi:hypothetical protein